MSRLQRYTAAKLCGEPDYRAVVAHNYDAAVLGLGETRTDEELKTKCVASLTIKARGLQEALDLITHNRPGPWVHSMLARVELDRIDWGRALYRVEAHYYARRVPEGTEMPRR
jgi:hypothetical protein